MAPLRRVARVDLRLAFVGARANRLDVESVRMETAISHMSKKLKLRIPILGVLSIAMIEIALVPFI